MKLESHITALHPCTLVDLLHDQTGLSKSALKRALTHGAVWLQKNGRGSKNRCRRATRSLVKGDKISLYFDDQLYSRKFPPVTAIVENKQWGIWFKPAGVLSQGSPYGDLGCLEQQVSTRTKCASVHLINRLDREAAGLTLVAYSKPAAAKLTQMWQQPSTKKYYQARILGTLTTEEGIIDLPLDGKTCQTRFRLITQDGETSCVEVSLASGRFHQIRRHFDQLGHPLIGDPRYGRGNKNDDGLQLVAHRLAFYCPLSKRSVDCQLPEELCLF